MTLQEMHDAISQEQMAQLARARGGDTRRAAMMDLQGRGDSVYGRVSIRFTTCRYSQLDHIVATWSMIFQDPVPARSYEEFRGREYAGDVYDRTLVFLISVCDLLVIHSNIFIVLEKHEHLREITTSHILNPEQLSPANVLVNIFNNFFSHRLLAYFWDCLFMAFESQDHVLWS